MKCPECAVGELAPHAEAGRRWSFRNIPDLLLPAELALPTCGSCGAIYVGHESAGQLDAALVPAYEAELRRKATEALEVLAEAGVTQRTMEPLLGLSGGYLSKVRRGKESSATLVSTLMLLAADPTLVTRLQQLWSVDVDLKEERKRSATRGSWVQRTTRGEAAAPFVRPQDEHQEPDQKQTFRVSDAGSRQD